MYPSIGVDCLARKQVNILKRTKVNGRQPMKNANQFSVLTPSQLSFFEVQYILRVHAEAGCGKIISGAEMNDFDSFSNVSIRKRVISRLNTGRETVVRRHQKLIA
jgi:hypothetical protein